LVGGSTIIYSSFFGSTITYCSFFSVPREFHYVLQRTQPSVAFFTILLEQ
jgi:hypothetical protein